MMVDSRPGSIASCELAAVLCLDRCLELEEGAAFAICAAVGDRAATGAGRRRSACLAGLVPAKSTSKASLAPFTAFESRFIASNMDVTSGPRLSCPLDCTGPRATSSRTVLMQASSSWSGLIAGMAPMAAFQSSTGQAPYSETARARIRLPRAWLARTAAFRPDLFSKSWASARSALATRKRFATASRRTDVSSSCLTLVMSTHLPRKWT
jgi:hypothetical protein